MNLRFAKSFMMILLFALFILTSLCGASDKSSPPYFKLDRAPHYTIPSAPGPVEGTIQSDEPTMTLGQISLYHRVTGYFLNKPFSNYDNRCVNTITAMDK